MKGRYHSFYKSSVLVALGLDYFQELALGWVAGWYCLTVE